MKEFLSTFHSGNQKLFGNLHLPYQNASCVITLHDLESSKDSGKWPTIAVGLTDMHACDLISGLWGEPEKSEGEFEDVRLTGRIRDYKAALQFLDTSKVDMSRLGVIGSSFGGMVAVAAQDERIKAMVCLSTPYYLPHISRGAGRNSKKGSMRI
jgi:pimeloyl-ACP methyl ester carboxylesterase